MVAMNIVVRVGGHGGAPPVATTEVGGADLTVTRDAEMITIRLPTAEVMLPVAAAEDLMAKIDRALRAGGFQLTPELYELRGSKSL